MLLRQCDDEINPYFVFRTASKGNEDFLAILKSITPLKCRLSSRLVYIHWQGHGVNEKTHESFSETSAVSLQE